MENQAIVRTSKRVALPQILATLVKNILLLGYGMTMGFPTILIPRLAKQAPTGDIYLSQDDISWIGSIEMLCVSAGCILSGIITPPIGRKKSMQIISTPFLICGVIFRYSDETWQIYLALALTGLAAGFLEAPVITYVAEITQPHLRGILGASGSLSVLLGTLLEFILGTFYDWRTVALLSGIPPTIAFCLLYFIPESPHWLVMHNRQEEAKKSLAWLRGWVTIPEIEEEFQEIAALQKKNEIDQPTRKEWFFSNYITKSFLHPLALISFIFFLCHFTGMTTLQTYSVHIFEALQSPIDRYYATIFVGTAQFLGTLFCVIGINFIGKRTLAFASLGISAISFTAAATYAYLIGVKYLFTGNVADDLEYGWIPVPCLIIAAFTLQGGIRVIPWIFIGEMYPRDTRSMGSGISGAIAYTFAFTANKLFLQTVAKLTLPGIFWFYSGVSLAGIVVLYFWLPETEGKTLQDITNHFEGISKLGNRIGRKHHCVQEPQYTDSRL